MARDKPTVSLVKVRKVDMVGIFRCVQRMEKVSGVLSITVWDGMAGTPPL